MGGKESKSAEILKFIEREWQYLKTNKQGAKVYRNRHTDNEAQLHTVGIEQKMNLEKEYDIYNYRRTQDNALVSIYAVQNIKDTAPNLCGNRNVLKVMVQSIPWRLADLPKLSLRESIYILSQAIRGYDDCYSKVGQFQITDQMMGLNSAGKLKVWLTQFFAQNHPTNEKPILQITTAQQLRSRADQQEQHMLRQVISLVEKKCVERYPTELLTTLRNQTSFADAYHHIEEFCLKNQLDIPDRVILENFSNNSTQANPVQFIQFEKDRASKVQQSNFSFQNKAAKETLIKQLNFQNPPPNAHYSQPAPIQSPNNTYGYVEPFYSTRQSNGNYNSMQFNERSRFQPETTTLQNTNVTNNLPLYRSGGVGFSYPNQQIPSPFNKEGFNPRGQSYF